MHYPSNCCFFSVPYGVRGCSRQVRFVPDRRGEMGGVGDGKVMGGIGEKSRGAGVFLTAAVWVWLFACGVGLVFLLVWSGFVFGCLLTVLAFPCILSGLLALPLCG